MNYVPNMVHDTPTGARYTNPYDMLFKDRIIFINDPITTDVAGNITAQMLALEASDHGSSINMYISSPGGDIDGISMVYDCMRFVSSPVTTLGMGSVAGASVVLLAAGERGHRFMLPNSRVILRQPQLSGGSSSSRATDIKIVSDELSRLRAWTEGILVESSTIPKEDIHGLLEHDTVLTAGDCVSHGIIDRVITSGNPRDMDGEG